MATQELIGNAALGADLAWVRLTVEEGRVVAARGDGPGMTELLRAVRGSTTLEAAAVPGGRLAPTPSTTRSGPR